MVLAKFAVGDIFWAYVVSIVLWERPWNPETGAFATLEPRNPCNLEMRGTVERFHTS